MSDDAQVNGGPGSTGDRDRQLRMTSTYVEYYFDGCKPKDEVTEVGDSESKLSKDAAPVDDEANEVEALSEDTPATERAAEEGLGVEAAEDPEKRDEAADTETPDDPQDAGRETLEDTNEDVPLPDEAEDGGDMDRRSNGMPGWLDLLITLACTLVLVFFIRTFVAEAYEVPTGSMLETIQLGDRLVGEKVSLRWREPQVGEIVTFMDPDGSGVTLIKRVIATAGQEVDLQDGSVVVDGKVLDESYTLGKPTYPLDHYAKNLNELVTFPLTVPEGHIWVMGDNRTNSLDSRYFGPVPVESVTSIGKFIFWPPADAQLL